MAEIKGILHIKTKSLGDYMLTKFEKTLILKTNALSNKVLYDLCAEYPFNCYDKDGYNKLDALTAQLL